MDVFHFKAQAACGFKVVGLDRDAEREPGRGSDAWKEWLACDNRVGPADEAASGSTSPPGSIARRRGGVHRAAGPPAFSFI